MGRSYATILNGARPGTPVIPAFDSEDWGAGPHVVGTEFLKESHAPYAASRIGQFMLLLLDPAGAQPARAAAMLPLHADGYWVLTIHPQSAQSSHDNSAGLGGGAVDVATFRIMDPAVETLASPARALLFLPVGLDPSLDAVFRAHGNGKLSPARATLLGSVLLSVAKALPVAPRHDYSFLADAVLAVLLAALSTDTTRHAEPPSLGMRVRARVEKIILRNLASARLDAARIARLAGVSRTTLYRAFEGTGGVSAHVQKLRLGRVLDELQDPSQSATPITAIAERNGFHCIASFNRSFRRAYGRTPGSVRARASARTQKLHAAASEGSQGPC